MPEKQFDLINKGLVLKLTPSALQPGQFMISSNCDSFKEGQVNPRPGSHRFNTALPPGVHWLLPHTLASMNIGSGDAANPRYVGEQSNIWRVTGPYTTAALVTTGLGLSINPNARWESQPYNSGDSGNPFMFFAHPVRMLKDDSTFNPLRRWGIPPPAQPTGLAIGGSVPNGPNGAYSYLYTFRNPQTGAEGNPCALPISAPVVAITATNNGTPDIITAPGNTLANGNTVTITGCIGDTAPNGTWTVANVGVAGAGTFELTGVNGNGVYAGGGVVLPQGAPGNINLVNQSAVITFYGTDDTTTAGSGDPALTGLGSIAIYRAGGAFADELYRFVGYGSNPGVTTGTNPLYGGIPLSGTFTDSASDLALIDARTIEFDNDMPVTSSLPVPFVGTVSNLDTGANPPFTRISLNAYPNYGFGLGIDWNQSTNPQGFFTPGSNVTVGTDANQETCIVFGVDQTSGVSSHWIDVFLQNTHSTGETVTCDAIAGVPCDLICLYQDAILLAGDPNNPFVVYRSKSGFPDAFPVIDLEDGNAHQLNVGSPSNPVMGILEFNGEVVCLNLKSIFVFIVLNGTMSPPQQAPSDRGMIAKNCWADVKNEIWFLSYDGIYSWSGGDARLRSEAIHSIFNSYSTVVGDQTYYPMSYKPVDLAAFYMECIDQEVWMHYQDVNGDTQTLRYQLLYERWLPAAVPDGIGAMMTEPDTGRFIIGVQDNTITPEPQSFLQQALTGTSDNWITSENDGEQIGWDLTTGYVSVEERTRLVQFTELVIEVLNPIMGAGDFININLSYDYLTQTTGPNVGAPQPDPVDGFSITAPNPKRTFISFPLQRSSVDGTAQGKEAMSVALSITGGTVNFVQIFSWTLRFNPLQIPVKNSILDWQSLGSPNDKQLYCLALEFDPKGQQVTLLMDVIAGYPGAQVPQVQDIVLQPAVWTYLQAAMTSNSLDPSYGFMNPVSPQNITTGTVIQIENELVFVTGVRIGSSFPVTRGYLGTVPANHASEIQIYSLGRVKQVFPLVDNIICKSVRLRPFIPAQQFEIFNFEFEPVEKYPPDIVFFSELDDNNDPFLKYYNQLAIDVATNDVLVTVGLELDGNIVFTFPVQTNRFTRYTNITCPSQLAGVNARILPQLPLAPGAKFQLWGVKYVTEKANPGAVSHSTDWNDLGTQFDKQLNTISFSYDGSQGDVAFNIDTLTGIQGDTITLAAITFQLSGTARGLQSFPFPDGYIVKALRVSPQDPVNIGFQSWGYSVTKLDYPPDVILWTDLTDNGSKYLKFVQQLVLEVDTNNVPVVVQLELDGNVKFSFTVTSTRLTRRQQVVCPNQLAAINMRILVQYPLAPNAKFQLWQPIEFVTQPADKAEISHSYDWDDIGWLWDKKLQNMTLEYDGSAGDLVLQMETVIGIQGTTPGPIMLFQLSGAGRSKQSFPIPDNTIVKLVRISPTAAPPLAYRGWKYSFDFIKYPIDISLFTDRTVLGYPCEKVARNLELDIDTGGIPATIQLWADGKLWQTVTVTTTLNDRSRIIALQSNIIGREFWLELQPGVGGKTQIFSWNISNVKEPCAVAYYDSLETRMSYVGWKFVKQYWIAYASTDTVVFNIYVDDDKLFWSVTLPAHPFRDEERGYLPPIDNTGQFLGKSKTYRFTLTATSGTFKLYADSGLDWFPFGAGQRTQKFLLTENQQLPIA